MIEIKNRNSFAIFGLDRLSYGVFGTRCFGALQKEGSFGMSVRSCAVCVGDLLMCYHLIFWPLILLLNYVKNAVSSDDDPY